MEILNELYEQFKTFFPNLVFAIVILIIGWLIAKIASTLVKKVLKSIKIDTLADRLNEIDIVQRVNLTILPSVIIGKVVYYFIMLIIFIIATEQLGIEAVTDLLKNFINYLPNLIVALVYFIVGLLIADAIKGIVATTCQSLGIPSAKVIANIIFYFLFLSVTMSALNQAKISTAFINSSLMIVIAGVVGAFAFGYGLASKRMMANFLATFYAKDKFKVGDLIALDGTKGEIIEISNSAFVLKTEKSNIVYPLSKLTETQVEIYSE